MDKREAIRGLIGHQFNERFQDKRQRMPRNATFEDGLFKGASEEMVAEENEAAIEKEIPMEIKRGSLSVSQALEKAKSLTDGNIMSQESYQDILNQIDEKERYPFTVALVEHEIRVAERVGAVNIIDEIDGPQGGDLWYPSKFPAGEIPSEESGTSELDFSHIRKVEGKKAQQIPEDFWDVATPQEANIMMGFVESNQYEDAWQLLKEVNSRVSDKNAEIGNSLIDLTTDKWAEQFSLNDLPRQVKTRYTEPVREPSNTKEYGSGHGPDSEAFEDKTMVSFAMKDMIEGD